MNSVSRTYDRAFNNADKSKLKFIENVSKEFGNEKSFEK